MTTLAPQASLALVLGCQIFIFLRSDVPWHLAFPSFQAKSLNMPFCHIPQQKMAFLGLFAPCSPKLFTIIGALYCWQVRGGCSVHFAVLCQLFHLFFQIYYFPNLLLCFSALCTGTQQFECSDVYFKQIMSLSVHPVIRKQIQLKQVSEARLQQEGFDSTAVPICRLHLLLFVPALKFPALSSYLSVCICSACQVTYICFAEGPSQ